MEINKVVCMDNLECMKSLPIESIDLIYGDILYGTGRKFKDYQDLKPDRKVIEDFYIPRVKEMHRLLKPTGSIYLQMDWRIVHWVRCILDDVFGYENFRAEVIWKYDAPTSTNRNYPAKHDNILFYTKSSNYYFNQDAILVEYSEKAKQRYDKIDEEGKRYKLYKNRDGSYRKAYMKQGKPTDIFEIQFLQNNSKEKVYDTQKPLPLMERIIKASSNKGDVVADFFMGSGSFLVKGKELGRCYIGCDNNPNAVEITKQRLIN